VGDNNFNSVSTFTTKQNAYVMPEGVCPDAWKDKDFVTQPLSTRSQEYDSCYYTQAIVYINYDGSCFKGFGDAGFAVSSSLCVRVCVHARVHAHVLPLPFRDSHEADNDRPSVVSSRVFVPTWGR
jgi:hypothetical protein